MTEHGGAAALKQNNLAALRSALYHTDFATKKELAEQCRLSLAACTALLGEMIDDGQVLELAFAASNGGRPARRFSINPNFAHILCLYTANNDVERSGIALRVCDLKGNSLQEKFCPLDDILPEDLTLFITKAVRIAVMKLVQRLEVTLMSWLIYKEMNLLFSLHNWMR